MAGPRRLLMIDYFFPPLAGSGAQRTLGFLTHLLDHGWSPVVLTARAGEHYFYDRSLLQRVPSSVTVVRTPSLEPVRFVKSIVTRMLNPRGPREAGVVQGKGRPWWRGPRVARALERWLLFPDRRIGWLPFAAARAVEVAKRNGIEIVFSTSTIMTSHLIAYLVKRTVGIPWVADFQDPWSESYITEFPTEYHRRAGEWLESLIVRSADRVTVTTEPMAGILHAKHSGVPREKFVVIPMGYHAEPFEQTRAIAWTKFTVTHFGGFWGSRSPGPFLTALGHWVRNDPTVAGSIQVFLLGNFDEAALRLTEDLIRRYRLEDIVSLKGFAAYQQGLEHVVSSHLLLLVADSGGCGKYLIPSKLYEYLAAGRPILALLPEGAAASVMREARAGLIVSPDDVAGIQQALATLYERWRDGHLAFDVDRRVVQRFEWGALTREFVRVLEGVLQSEGGRARRCR